MVPLHLLHKNNRKTYLILICPLIPKILKAKRIKRLNSHLMKDLIITSKNEYIFRLCYKYNQEELMECFKFDNTRLLICTPFDLITASFLDEINLDYTIFIDYLYKGASYCIFNNFGLAYPLIKKIITLKKDILIDIIKSNKLTPHFKIMTEQDKKLINSLVPLEEINYQPSTKQPINPPSNSTNTPQNIIKDISLPQNVGPSNSKKLILKKNKHY